MSAFLLVVIYLIFLSLGLPDSTLGSAWPSICLDLGIDEGLQGCVSAIVAAGTIISSLSTSFLNRHLRRYGTVCLSICLTACGLVCYSYSSSFPLLCLSAIPLGLGAGAIDSTLSDYVANNYKAIHMNVLNAFWGIGALTSPFIISAFLSSESLGWRKAVLCLALIQGIILILSLSIIPVWAKLDRFRLQRGEKLDDAQGLVRTLKRPGVIFAMLCLFCYIAIEQTTFNWASSLAYFGYGQSEGFSSSLTSYFFIGIVISRLASGVLSLKLGDAALIRLGECFLFIGAILLFFGSYPFILILAIFLIGFGCGPVYPSSLHAAPRRFGVSYSSSAISLQMVSGYVAATAMSPLFGAIGQFLTFKALPVWILVLLFLLAFGLEMTEKLSKRNEVGAKAV